MSEAAQHSPGEPFRGVSERASGDQLLRTAQQHHVQMSAMADTKANIIITVSSIVLTLAFGRLNDPVLGAGAVVLSVFTLLALLLAILAVLPKFRSVRVKAGELPDDFNLLFFGHFSQLSRERFLREMDALMSQPGAVYEHLANDLYSLGTYLARYKYPYLRYAYQSLLAGFLLAATTEVIRWINR